MTNLLSISNFRVQKLVLVSTILATISFGAMVSVANAQVGATSASGTQYNEEAKIINEARNRLDNLKSKMNFGATANKIQKTSSRQSLNGNTKRVTGKVITTDRLSVREYPAGKLIRVVPKGTTATILEGPVSLEGKTWYQLKYDIMLPRQCPNSGGVGYSVACASDESERYLTGYSAAAWLQASSVNDETIEDGDIYESQIWGEGCKINVSGHNSCYGKIGWQARDVEKPSVMNNRMNDKDGMDRAIYKNSYESGKRVPLRYGETTYSLYKINQSLNNRLDSVELKATCGNGLMWSNKNNACIEAEYDFNRPQTNDELQTQLEMLLAMVAKLKAQLNNDNPDNSSNLSVGLWAITTDRLSVRATAGGSFIKVVPKGSIGKVVAGPVTTSNGRTWFKIDYQNNVTGWSAANWLREVSRNDNEDNPVVDPVEEPVHGPTLKASVTSGQAPLVVFFDVNYSGQAGPAEIHYGDGEKDNANYCYAPNDLCVRAGTNTHLYEKPGTYRVRLVKVNGGKVLGEVSIRVSREVVVDDDTDEVDNDTYNIGDVKSVTFKYIDPIPNAVDDEYNLYKITLKTGVKFEVKSDYFAPKSANDQKFYDTGFRGDVDDIRNMAREVKDPTNDTLAKCMATFENQYKNTNKVIAGINVTLAMMGEDTYSIYGNGSVTKKEFRKGPESGTTWKEAGLSQTELNRFVKSLCENGKTRQNRVNDNIADGTTVTFTVHLPEVENSHYRSNKNFSDTLAEAEGLIIDQNYR